MPQILAYIRTSTDKQDNDNQKLEIHEYTRNKKMKVNEVIEIQMSSQKGRVQRRIEELMEKLHEGDTLIVTEISRLGRSTTEVIHLINAMIKSNVRIISIKQSLDISKHDMSSKIIVTIFSLLAELERDLISLRTKEALSAKKAKGIKLGKPMGTIQRSKFDKDIERIKELLSLGVSIRRSSKILGYSSHIGLSKYIRTRKVMDEVKKTY